MTALDWSRVIVVGANGAGKTRAARVLAARLDVAVLHKDRFALTRAWRQRAANEVQIERALRQARVPVLRLPDMADLPVSWF